MQLKVTADVKEKKYEIRKSKERIIRRVSNEKMYVYRFMNYSGANVFDSPCDKTKEIVVQLYEYRRKYGVVKDKVQIFSKTVSLQDDVLYTEKTYTSEWTSWPIKNNTDCLLGDDNEGVITITFAYSPGGSSIFLPTN